MTIDFEDRKARYIKSDPYFCLYCEARTTSVAGLEADYDQAFRDVVCNTCKKRWVEIFQLTDVEEWNGDDF